MMKKFKQPLSIDQQISHLESSKKVVFQYITKSDAYDYLLKFNYINVITPFKHVFAEKSKNLQLEKDQNGNHIYQKSTEFENYVMLYRNERSTYSNIFQCISKFETIFNAVFSYEVVINYDLSNEKRVADFILSLKFNSQKYYEGQKAMVNIVHSIDTLEKSIQDIGNIFVSFDRLSLNNLCNIFKVLNLPNKINIFNILKRYDCTLNFEDLHTFESNFFRIVGIRNAVYHNNSLEILTRFYNFKNGELRNSSDQKKYRNLIKKLSV